MPNLTQYTVREDGCWIWTGIINGYGYGQVIDHGRRPMAHRKMYETLVGPIPEGLTLDHLCRVHACVNPGHLEPVTIRENTLRGNTTPAANAAKTHCLRGHPLAGDNLYRTPDGRRQCRACWKIRAGSRSSEGG